MSVGCRDLIPEVHEIVVLNSRFVDGRKKKTLELLPKIDDLILEIIISILLIYKVKLRLL